MFSRLSCRVACVVLLISFAGCATKLEKSASKTFSSKTGSADPKITIAKKPDIDELTAAVEAANGDVVKALQNIGAHVDTNTAGQIEYVDLSGKKLTAEGLKHLSKLADTLQRISLNDAYVTGDGLKTLVELPHLRKLELNRTPLTDSDLEQLAEIQQLRELSLRETDIGDDGMQHLARLAELRQLFLSGTQITNKGLAHLGQLPKLHTLTLDDTAVSDDGLKSIPSTTRLRYLHLAGTKVTALAASQFRHNNPRVKIVGL